MLYVGVSCFSATALTVLREQLRLWNKLVISLLVVIGNQALLYCEAL